MQAIERSVKYLQKAAAQKNNVVRAKAIKVLCSLVDLGNLEVIQDACDLVNARHADVTPSVREAALQLLSHILHAMPSRVEEHVAVLEERLSVRERASACTVWFVVGIAVALSRLRLRYTCCCRTNRWQSGSARLR